MKHRRFLVLATLIVATVALPIAHAQEQPSTAAQRPPKTASPVNAEAAVDDGSIVGVAAAAGDLGTFVKAVQAAGLTHKLQGEGPFTIFAPSDAAFAKLPEGTVQSLLEPANRAKLAGILACHVVPGKLMAADVKTMKATNVSGNDLQIEVHDGEVTVDGAKVIEADLVADNGVIHVIDSVIMPESGSAPAAAKPKDHPAH